MQGKKIGDLKIILSGQLITSRTETLEEYLKERVDLLGVIGITSPFALKNFSRCTIYEKGRETREFKLPSFQVGNMKWYKQPLLGISFLLYLISMISAAIRLRIKFDIFIGVACFSTFAGIFLKKTKIVKNLIYYSIDYYPMPLKFSFNTLAVSVFRFIDKLCVKNADLTWHISPRIADARYKFTKVFSNSYKHIVAPLTYASRLQRFRPIDQIERYSIGFVGTLSENQGLQLLVKAMPKIIREVPQIKVRIIGKGPYEAELKKMVDTFNLNKYFIFHGFIKDDNEVLEILSRCALGVAPWTCQQDDNVLYADPGKPKLYAFCGLPIIITNGTFIEKEIREKKVGISINYDVNELKEAIIKLLKDEDVFKLYKNNTIEFAKRYTTERIFDSVLRESTLYFN